MVYLLIIYFTMMASSDSCGPSSFIGDDDDRLLKMVSSYQLKGKKVDWDAIQSIFGSMTKSEIYGWYDSILSRTIQFRKWTPEEDELLLNTRSQGFPWDAISKLFNERTVKSLQSRYRQLTKNKLNASIEKSRKVMNEAVQVAKTESAFKPVIKKVTNVPVFPSFNDLLVCRDSKQNKIMPRLQYVQAPKDLVLPELNILGNHLYV